ncbi:RNA polymerase subunit sigma [Actinoplanes cyaneus]|uniref:RNA polymerase subunit sigma n=1 Tax=Actinoplanes cyaneus TaxID=52696 RepID=A0A919M3M2_9ACTN|nr:zf-HC2 domain-containing protein [Actinoplanes cyaneus]MCW2141960.1 putative zinc-finger [Actinoplanes cyaneus]GID68435.1 RNA polymerase subunit sigma [Actinoplanes cyaneus]
MSDLDEHDSLHRLLGGYLLGGLDEADTDRLDAHLHDCAECRAELDRLAPVPDMLQHLPDARHLGGDLPPLTVAPAARPSPQNIENLLSRMRAEKTRESRVSRTRWLVAASVAVIAAGAIGYGVIVNNGGGGGTPQNPPAAVQQITANFQAAAGSGMTGQATLVKKAWGVQVSLNMTGMSGKAPFFCIVKRADGKQEQAAVWGETPEHTAKVDGSSSFTATDVKEILITDADGKALGSATVT